MSIRDKEILKLLGKIRRRIFAKNTMEYTLLSVAGALSLSLAAYIISRMIPIYYFYTFVVVLISISAALGIITGILKKPDYVKAALAIDSIGLKERAVTAYELIGSESSIADMQKNDALSHLSKVPYKKHISIFPKRKNSIICVCLAVCFVATGFIPNSMAEKAKAEHVLKKAKQEQINKVEEAIKEINKNDKLTAEQKKDMENKLTELKKDIMNSKTSEEFKKSVERSEKKLEQLQEKYNNENIKKLQEALSKQNSTKALSEALKSGDKEKSEEELKKLSDALNNMSKEQKAALSEKLKAAAQSMGNESLKENTNNLAASLNDGSNEGISKSVSELSKNISELMEGNEAANMLQELQQSLGEQSSQGESQEGAYGNSSNGEGTQNGNGKGNGQGSQQGEGNGSGAGSGTGMNEQEGSGYSTGMNKKDSSERKEGEYEKIYAPKNLGGTGTQSQLKGRKNQNGTSDYQFDEDQEALRGEMLPYNQVFGEYSDRAMEGLNDSDIPEGMMDLIKYYFSYLGD